MTEERAWTAGQWVSCYDNADEEWGVRSSDGGLLVASMGLSDFTLQSDADHARLIAAAPDLYEALKRISDLTPAAANAATARDLHLTVKAIADTALQRAEASNG